MEKGREINKTNEITFKRKQKTHFIAHEHYLCNSFSLIYRVSTKFQKISDFLHSIVNY